MTMSGDNHRPRRSQSSDASAERDESAAIRAATAVVRTREAIQRDVAARRRDVSAIARDNAGEASARAAERKEASLENGGPTDPEVTALKESAATLRATTASDRKHAAGDRASGADDRAKAADDRRQARVDLRAAYLDDLTGVYTRGLGLLTLQHEIDRAHRSGEPFVLAFIDVDGLKKINDHKGHAAGDALLQAVAAELRSKLRSYDPIVRMGGDEFVCAFSNTGLEAAAGRVREIKASLEEKQVDSSISVGFAELCPGENLEDLTARGDAELYRFKPTDQPALLGERRR